MTGFVALQSPQDLVAKLQHDLRTFEADPLDAYVAFNFFLTAEHMPDWWHPGKEGKAAREWLRESSPLLQVTSHLANSGKHFKVEAKHHQSVRSARNEGGVFADVYGDVFGGVYGRRMVVHLDGSAANIFGESIEALELARQVVAFWLAYKPAG
jgi:hypothetical protein